MKKFYGRTGELAALRKLDERMRSQGSARMAVISGYPNMGTTTLLQHIFDKDDIPVLTLAVDANQPEQCQVKSFVESVKSKLQLAEDETQKLHTFSELLRFLMECSYTLPMRLIIDDCQNIDEIAPNFWGRLQGQWDLNKDHSRLFLIFAGSDPECLRRVFGYGNATLYGRLDNFLELRPFGPNVMREVFSDIASSADNRNLLMFYAVTGGIPGIVARFSELGLFTTQALLDYVFGETGDWYRNVFCRCLEDAFGGQTPLYLDVLTAVATHTVDEKRKDPQCGSKVDDCLWSLEHRFGLICREDPICDEPNNEETDYSIGNSAVHFFLLFLAGRDLDNLHESLKLTSLRAEFEQELPDFQKEAFKRWLVASYWETGRWTNVGTWRSRQEDLAIDIVAYNSFSGNIEFSNVQITKENIDNSKFWMGVKRFKETHRNLLTSSINYRNFCLQNYFAFVNEKFVNHQHMMSQNDRIETSVGKIVARSALGSSQRMLEMFAAGGCVTIAFPSSVGWTFPTDTFYGLLLSTLAAVLLSIYREYV